MSKSNIAHLAQNHREHNSLSWFADRVSRSQSGPFSEIATLTPAIAQRLLEANEDNRPINQRMVNEIASDIENGFWRLNGETIIVSREGLLNDGQHRLEAVIKTGKPIETAIMFGVERDTRLTTDMGRQRSAGNFLAMDKTANANNAAAVSKTLIEFNEGIYRQGGTGGGRVPTKQEIRDFYLNNRKRVDNAVSFAIGDKFGRVAGITPVAAAYFLLHKANNAEAAVFFARMMDGANLKPNDPILWMRNRLMAEKKNWIRASEKLEIILRYWNRWRQGAKVTRQIALERSFPRIER